MTSKIAIPGPRGWPIVGYKVDINKFHVACYNLMQKYGTIFQFSRFRQVVVVISDKSLMETAFQKETLCHRPSGFMETIKYHGKGVVMTNFTSEDTELKALVWKCIRNAYSDVVLKSFMDKDLDRFLEELDKEGDVATLEQVRQACASQFAIWLTGREGNKEHADVVVQYLDSLENLFKGGKVPILSKMSWLRHIPYLFKPSVERITKARDQLVALLVRDARSGYRPGQEHGILQQLLAQQSTVSGAESLKDENLFACTMDLVTNTVEGTVRNVAFVILQALKNPDMQQKIHEELEKVKPDMVASMPNPEHLPYLEAFTLECIRYYSVSNVCIPHWASEDTELEGFTIPKGAIIVGNLYNMHHDERIWNEPWKFSPERFLDENGQILPLSHPVRNSMVVFGTGMRACRGKDLAMDRIFRLVIGIFQKYKVLPPANGRLPSADPRDYATTLIINQPAFQCRFQKKELHTSYSTKL